MFLRSDRSLKPKHPFAENNNEKDKLNKCIPHQFLLYHQIDCTLRIKMEIAFNVVFLSLEENLEIR